MEGDDVLLEVQRAVVICVEGSKHMLGIILGVAVREELAVNGLKLFFRDASGGTLLLEVFVPLDDLCLGKLSVELQFFQDLLGHGTALGVSHR